MFPILYPITVIYYRSPLQIKIEIEVSRDINGRGPAKFIEGINDILPYQTNNCIFIASQTIYPVNAKNKSDYFFLPLPHLEEKIYKEWAKIKRARKLILGPIFVPNFWNLFPDNNIWNERKFREIINTVKGIGVHSNRVRNYLAQRSNTTNMISKYIIIRACTNLKPENVKSFKNRTIDILFFEKYQDLNRTNQGVKLIKLFKNSSKKIVQIKYGNYTNEEMQILANNSKFIIYFSFFDTGAIGLKEIQNYGVFTFSHQKDLVINNETGFYIPELADEYNVNNAYIKIIKKMKIIAQLLPDSYLIAKKNQESNKCQNTLEDLCNSLMKI